MNHKEQAHAFMQKFISTEETHVIDMTCGNGYDTLYLAEHCERVTAIDIQKQAIEATQERCHAYSNVTYINKAHETVYYKKMTPIHGAIYNLGYLPNSDKSIITRSESTIQSLQLITPLLESFLVIAAYRGHDGGNDEYLAVKEFLESTYETFQTIRYETPLSPVTFLVDVAAYRK